MSKYRGALPQLTGDIFITDGGIETTLIFHEGFDLPHFAAFDLLTHDTGTQALRKYYRSHAAIARDHGVGFILESATWRASADWGEKLGYGATDITEVNRRAITILAELREEFETDATKVVVSGCIGPRGDGYNPETLMTEAEAENYHWHQVEAFNESGADMVTAITMTHTQEAIGITRAAQAAGLPVVISFTVETDGSLPSGQDLKDAIRQVDQATDDGPAYYMINCAHPEHFDDTLNDDDDWVTRIRGLRTNASRLSHAELDEAEELDDGNPAELGAQNKALRDRLSHLNVFGGCCGTDHRHIGEICRAVAPQPDQLKVAV